MGKPSSCMQFIKSCISYYKSRENLYQVLQVTRESVSGTTSHVRCVWACNEIEGLYDKIIITIVPRYTGKNITRLLPLALLLVLRTRNNTDGNKLMIFSSIALYYGDTYIVSELLHFFTVVDSLFFNQLESYYTFHCCSANQWATYYTREETDQWHMIHITGWSHACLHNFLSHAKEVNCSSC